MSHRHYSIKEKELPKINSRLLSISLSKDERDWPSVLHTHPFTEIFFVLNGKGNFFFRRDIRPIETGDLIIIPPYLEHTEQSIPGTPLEYIMSWESTASPFRKKTSPLLLRFSVTLTIWL